MFWVDGGGWSGWRIAPFYGSYEWTAADGEPRSRRWFVLWPFYIRGQEYLNRDPTEIFFSLPFYGVRENSRSRTVTILWPFYVHHHDKRRNRDLHGGYLLPYRFTDGQRAFVFPL